jgi:hypothetical protein
MTTSREDAIRIADAFRSYFSDDESAFNDARLAGYDGWVAAAKLAEVEFPVAQTRRAVLTILEERVKHPDPFEGMPRT